MNSDILELYQQIIRSLQASSNSAKAQKMRAYMRNKFEFFGVSSPERKLMNRPVLLIVRKKTREQKLQLCDLLYENKHRESHYVAIEIWML